MAIFNRWGTPLTVKADCGQHGKRRLARVTFHDEDGEDRDGYLFHHSLRADGSVQEINKAFNEAPKVTLYGKELEAAIERAQ